MKHWMIAAGVSGTVVAASSLAQPPRAPATPAEIASYSAPRPCTPYAGMRFICEQKNVEDMEFLPGTPWVITSGMNNRFQPGNGFGLIDSRTATWHPGYPKGGVHNAWDKTQFGDCPGEPDPGRVGPHGLTVRKEKDGSFTVYSTNHGGGRETVEAYRVVAKGDAVPEMTWIGCVPLPGPGAFNAVAARPDGGFYVTRMFGNTADRWTRYNMAERDGRVFGWQPGKPLSEVPNTAFAGNNGIALSPDGHWMFVNSRLTAEVVKLDMTGPEPREAGRIKLNFLPDNVKWTGDGTISATGHHASEAGMSEINSSPAPSGDIAWAVARIDPVSMTIVKRMDVWGNKYFGGGTTGLQVGNEIWAGSFRTDRIARVPIDFHAPQ